MILVINLGLKSIRAILFDGDGQRLATAALPVSTSLRGVFVEQSSDEWWEKLALVVNEVTLDPEIARRVELITVSCSASCLVPVDADCQGVGPVMMVSDRRAEQEAEDIKKLASFQTLASKHGFACTSFSQLARVLWMKRHQPEAYAKVDRFLAPNDFLIAKLTGGTTATDVLNAEKVYFQKEKASYPKELLKDLDVRESFFPEVKKSGALVGSVADSVAAKLHLPTGVPIRLSTYDAICSVFGTGVIEAGKVCDVSGTVTSVRMYSDKPIVDKQNRIFCQAFEPADCFLLGGSNNLGGGLVEWTKQCFYSGEEYAYEVMELEARASMPGSNGLIFVPHLLGARAPRWNSGARGAFFGLERHHTRGDLARAVFESIGYSIREFTDIFEELGNPVTSFTASGGLARIPLVNEIKADIIGVEYHIMDEFESTCLGAAIIAMVAHGSYPSIRDACNHMVRTRQIFLPRPQNRTLYDDFYQLYLSTFDQLEPLFGVRSKLIEKHELLHLERVENL